VSNVAQALWCEALKAQRARMPLVTVLIFSFAPLAGGFFMIVLRDPALARRVGLISAKAQIVAGTADWPTYLGLLAQITAVGGILLFSVIGSWVFGREFADRTVTDLLALPAPRSAVVTAKLILVVLWSAALTVVIYLVGLVVGAAIGLPPAPPETFRQGSVTIAVTAALTIVAVTPVAFAASAGRGYLPPMGAAILALILAQLVAAAGWGEYFPWSVPALYAGMSGPEFASLGAASYVIVGLTSLAGIAATFLWWARADQSG
jgi:ABC-2 type transport system permease protein